MIVTPIVVSQSRWGFHPCDYETFWKLRRLNFLALRARIVGAAHERWERKLPKNRIVRQTVRDQTGRRIGREPKPDAVGNIIAIPEPKRPIACQQIQVAGSQFARDVLELIEQDYRNARTPRGSQTEVIPLGLTAAQIDEQLARLEIWAAMT